MTELDRSPGWDRRAIMRIASEQYGNLEGMFVAHGWDSGGRIISQVAPTLVVETYGSVEAFERAHNAGRTGNAILDPWAAIDDDPPNVWLTSFYGFDPDEWGFLGFSDESMRASFLRRSAPGALIVSYATGGAEVGMRGKVVGILQVSHRTGDAREFMTADAYRVKQEDPAQRGKWNHGVKAIRAWKVTRETWMPVEQFAPITYSPGRARAIGARGMRLDPSEARRIRELGLFAFPVADGPTFDPGLPGPAESILSPSRAGPVSQAPYMVREAEGPKHLYILHLEGDADAFLGSASNGAKIVKVGMSCSPATRCDNHNNALPAGAFKWSVIHSTAEGGGAAFPSSKHALAGEQAMKDYLKTAGKSLGREFFLADPKTLDTAWQGGVQAAAKWKA